MKNEMIRVILPHCIQGRRAKQPRGDVRADTGQTLAPGTVGSGQGSLRPQGRSSRRSGWSPPQSFFRVRESSALLLRSFD